MKIEILPDADAVARKAAEVIAADARASVLARGRFVMAVSGGHTPWQMLRAWRTKMCRGRTYMWRRSTSASRRRETRIEISVTCVKACSSTRRCDPSRSLPCPWSGLT